MFDQTLSLTELLAAVRAGDNRAEADLFERVYADLRKVATRHLRYGDVGGTITPTALIHEAYLRVFRTTALLPTNRKHLFFAFSRAMWQLLVERSRKRILTRTRVELDCIAQQTEASGDDLCDLDEGFRNLERLHPLEYETAMLRTVLGFGVQESADCLGISAPTVKRRWAFAKAFLSRSLLRGERRNGSTTTAT